MTEDKIVGWHHRLGRDEFEQTSQDSEGQRLAVLQAMGMQRVEHDLGTEQQLNTIDRYKGTHVTSVQSRSTHYKQIYIHQCIKMENKTCKIFINIAIIKSSKVI